MIRKITLFTVVMFLLAGSAVLTGHASQGKGDAAADQKKLEGNWDVVALIQAGEEAPDSKDAKLVFIFKGDKMTVKSDGADSKGEASFTLDVTTMPRLIDLTSTKPEKGKKYLGIYEVKENELKLCVNLLGRDRPTEFASKAGERDQVLITLKRAKP